MMTARSLDLPFVPIRDEWLLPPENDERDRDITRLKDELYKLRRSEPQFRISCHDDKGVKVNEIQVQCYLYRPLGQDEISEFIELLRNRFPPATHFGSRKIIRVKDMVSPMDFASRKEFYASDEGISRYKDQEYPDWIERCTNILRNLHEKLPPDSGWPYFCFAVANEGSRPGNDTLINIVARGNFKIFPPQRRDDSDIEEEERELSLPQPPIPPHLVNPMSSLSNLMPETMVPLIQARDLPFQRDKNCFYYNPEEPEKPVESFSLECEQWRHRSGDEYFCGEIHFERGVNKVSGAIECEIHAENLSSPTKKIFPVRITIRRVSARKHAAALIDSLSNSSS